MDVPSREEILKIFYPYAAVRSESGTSAENLAGDFFRSHISENPYFARNPGQFGRRALPDDPFGRGVEWALVRGSGNRTVVLMHHFDVVEIEDFGKLKPLAFDPEHLPTALSEMAGDLGAEVREDLESGRYIFGRGSADMKAGGAIQMALIDSASRNSRLSGNLLLLGLPDEENLSAGMRCAAGLLAELKRQFSLEYVLMINSEPHQRKAPSVGVISGGSIGKIMPFLYVRGILAHAGKSPEGFNPLSVLSDVVRRTEMSLDFVEEMDSVSEMSPPPTWLMARDSKTAYDVSMPSSAFGCLSVHPLSNQPGLILETFRKVCEAAASETAQQVNRASVLFRSRTGRAPWEKGREVRVLSFGGLVSALEARSPAAFAELYEKALDRSREDLGRGAVPIYKAVWTLVETLVDRLGCQDPVAVFGLLPPYYPSVSHVDRPDFDSSVRTLAASLADLARGAWGQDYELESYFTGISDLSYSSLADAPGVESVIRAEMPLYGDFYSIPFASIAEISMPCVNIGPWGKDFHKMTERVLREDLTERTPRLLTEAVRIALRE